MFDKIYCINLARRPDRWRNFCQRFPSSWPFGFPERVEALDGQKIPKPSYYSQQPGAWGCVLPGNAVQGRIKAVSKSIYSGECVEIITRLGESTTLTVNHPVLTRNGFVKAGQIQEGDNLLCYRKNGEISSSDNNIQQGPFLIEDIFDSLLSKGATTRSKGASSLDFYGDGKFIKGNIQIIDADRFLLDARNVHSDEGSKQDVFLWRHLDLEGSFSHFGSSQLGCENMLLPIFCRNAYPLGKLSLRAGAESNTSPPQNSFDAGPIRVAAGGDAPRGAPKFSCQGKGWFASQIPVDNLGFFTGTKLSGVSKIGSNRSASQTNSRFSKSLGDSIIRKTDISSNRGYGFSSDISVGKFIDVRHGYHQRLGFASNLDVAFNQPAFESMVANTDLLRKLINRFPREISFDDVVEIRRFHYDGPVYDLETSVGYFTVTSQKENSESGIIVSNCLRTHLRLMEDALNHGHDIFIFEDDCVFVDDFAERSQAFFDELPDDWQMIYLGGLHRAPKSHPPIQVSENVCLGRAITTTYAYGLRHKFVKTLYPLLCEVEQHHIDQMLARLQAANEWRVYCPVPWLVGMDAGLSDICDRHYAGVHWWNYSPAQADEPLHLVHLISRQRLKNGEWQDVNLHHVTSEEGNDIDGWFSSGCAKVYRRELQKYKGGTLVEVGCWRGRSLSFLADMIANKDITAHAVDPWTGNSDPKDPTHKMDVFADFQKNMQSLGIYDLLHIHRKQSVLTAPEFKNNSVDVVMIDADHSYDYVYADIVSWWPKVKPGGVLMGHDYSLACGCPEVVGAVNDFARSANLTVEADADMWIIRKNLEPVEISQNKQESVHASA